MVEHQNTMGSPESVLGPRSNPPPPQLANQASLEGHSLGTARTQVLNYMHAASVQLGSLVPGLQPLSSSCVFVTFSVRGSSERQEQSPMSKMV